jgi:TetR/AcrR family transcriptional regulator, transcriptional repressor for nem operon
MSNELSTYDQILACARTLIIDGGYNGFSYADIAEVVEIRKPSIHHHFPSKADLVRALVSRYREEAQAGIAELERHVPDPGDQLRAYAKYWQTCITDQQAPFCLCAMLASEMPALPEEVALEVKAHFRSLSAWLTSVFERGATARRLKLSHRPHVEAEGFMALIHGAMLAARAYGDPKSFDLIVNPYLDRILINS